MATEDIPNIPIRIKWQGKVYSGHFSRATGAGSSLSFHLYISGYFMGQFFHRQGHWVLCLYGEKRDHPLSGYYEAYIISYLDGVMTTAEW